RFFWRRRVPRPRCGKTRLNILFGALGRESDSPGAAANEEIALGSPFHPFPFQEDGLRAALAAHDADRLVLNDLRLGIDASSRTIAEPVAHDLRKVKHEFVIGFELVMLDTDNRPVI